MISIIMTYYNTPYDKIKQAIDSVLIQTYKDYQFIIVDDGSESNKDIDDYVQSNPQIELIRLDHNIGQAEAQNIALIYARGDYLYFLDADDYIYERTLELLSKADADICVAKYTRDERVELGSGDNNIRTLDKYQVLRTLCQYTPTISSVMFNAIWNKLYHRKVFEGVKFPTGLTHNDTFITHKLLWNADKITYIPIVTYHYRIGGSIAGRKLYDNQDMILAHEARLQFLENNVHDEGIILNEKGRLLTTMVRTFYATKEQGIIDKMITFIMDNKDLNRWSDYRNARRVILLERNIDIRTESEIY